MYLPNLKSFKIETFRSYLFNCHSTSERQKEKLFCTIIAALAEWKHLILSERTKAGMDEARRKGEQIGRPPQLTDELIEWTKEQLLAANGPGLEVRNFFVSFVSVHRSLDDLSIVVLRD
jgi:DNA invertase Pin-like site-specific DNA recombinase